MKQRPGSTIFHGGGVLIIQMMRQEKIGNRKGKKTCFKKGRRVKLKPDSITFSHFRG